MANPSLSLSFTDRTVTAKPYKGAESYQTEDSELFFGRAVEAEKIASLFLSARLSVLHAPSGAGKSSVLNAMVIPRLERGGVLTVRVIPQDNPIDAVRVGALLQLLPPPSVEAAAIERFTDHLPALAKEPISQVLDAYDKIALDGAPRRQLLTPYTVTIGLQGGRQRSGSTTPFFCRLLRRTVSVAAFAGHCRSLFSLAVPDYAADLTPELPLDEWIKRLHSDAATEAYNRWIESLDIPEYGFGKFFKNLGQHWGALHKNYAVCLIVDQFEELFTRFADIGSGDSLGSSDGASATEAPVPKVPLDWQLRPLFFREIFNLLDDNEKQGTASPLSIRIVLSLRDEYLGRLEAVKIIKKYIANSTYRLDFLSSRDAAAVIGRPARLYSYDYSPECYAQIIHDLVRENRYVEPAHVQIVCEKMWHAFGQDIYKNSTDEGEAPSEGLKLIDINSFMALGGTQAILRNYFEECLQRLADKLGKDTPVEAVDMLSLLITNQATRNVVERSVIVDAPLRDSDVRKEILDFLQAMNIVRVEARLGAEFVEITHEFLLGPLQIAVRKYLLDDREEQAFRFALQAFDGVRNSGGTYVERAERLSGSTFTALMRNFDRLRWSDWSVAIALCAGLRFDSKREDLNRLLKVYANLHQWPEAEERDEAAMQRLLSASKTLSTRQDTRDWFTPRELSILLAKSWNRDAQDSQVAYWGLASALHQGDPQVVREWTVLAAGVGSMKTAIDIVLQYDGVPEERVRRNVCVALGIISTPEAVSKLAEIGASDESERVREQAADEIAHVSDSLSRPLEDRLWSQLGTADRWRPAFDLLSRIAVRRPLASENAIPWFSQLRRLTSLNFQTLFARLPGYSFRGRVAFGKLFLTSIVPLLIMIVWISVSFPGFDTSSLSLYQHLAAAVLDFLFLTFYFTFRIPPTIVLYGRARQVLDVMVIIVGTVIVYALTLFLISSLAGGPRIWMIDDIDYMSLDHFSILIFFVTLPLIAMRVFGFVFAIRSFVSRPLATILAYGGSLGAGFSVLVLSIWLIPTSIVDEDFAGLAVFVACFVILSFSVVLDPGSTDLRIRREWGGRLPENAVEASAAFLLVAAVMILVLSTGVLVPTSNVTSSFPILKNLESDRVVGFEWDGETKARYSFEVKTRGELGIMTPSPVYGTMAVILNNEGTEVDKLSVGKIQSTSSLIPGTYAIEISPSNPTGPRLNLGSFLTVLEDRFATSLRIYKQVPDKGTVSLQISWTADLAKSSQ